MKIFFQFIGWLFLIVLLTVLSQTGGIILILYLFLRALFSKSLPRYKKIAFNTALFTFLYLGVNFLIVPSMAKKYGKVPMPVFSDNLQPHRLAFVLLNRHYVTPTMKKTMVRAAEEMNEKYPNSVVYYLDGSHPIGNPRLLPHLKHESGRKLDYCFFYKNKKDESTDGKNPSLFGYGYFVKPQKGETNQPQKCKNQGSWWYDFTKAFVWENTGQAVEIDIEKSSYFLNLLTKNQKVSRIFIEPHLKERFEMQGNNKLRYHGCWAVRHDDHAHLEVR